MNLHRKHRVCLDVLSKLDEKIIDRASAQRYRLLTRRRRTRLWIRVAASAACLAILLSGILFIPLLDRQVPVYRGMTVSDTPPFAQASAALPEDLIDRVQPLGSALRAPDHATAFLKTDTPNTNSSGQNPPEKTEAETERKPSVTGTERELYYARPWQDIYITVHIDNPAQYEIQSFTLNGKTYSAYMFETGSDMENLVLKVNVGDVEGYTEYTIDAIKYIDGTRIKDVRFEGDRTVRVGVYPENQPTVALKSTSVDYESLYFEVTLTDPLSLIEVSSGSIKAVLYRNDRVVESRDLLSDQNNEVHFSELSPGTEYRFLVVADYDALDGQGFASHVLCEKTVCTKSFVDIEDLTVRGNDISFTVCVADGRGVSIEAIELLDGRLGLVRTGNADTRSFDELFIGEYFIRLSYSYDGTRRGTVMTDLRSISTLGTIQDLVRESFVSIHYSEKPNHFYPALEDHLGVDIKAMLQSEDDGVYAGFSGTVTHVDASNGTVVLLFRDGQIELTYKSLRDIAVREGDVVTRGQRLGSLGDTLAHESELGNHVHVELRVNGAVKNPLEYFTEPPRFSP